MLFHWVLHRNLVFNNHKESLGIIACFLNHSEYQHINLIDVGCFKGWFLRDFKYHIKKRVFSISIDPICYFQEIPYSIFVESAIANEPEGICQFYEYNDPQCSSLKKMITQNITHDIREKEAKWFIGRKIESLLNVRPVKTMRLATVIEQNKLKEETIHFLKIDAQGSDLEVLLSLGDYIKNCLFAQLETVSSKNKNIVLYKGQPIFEQERVIIENLGFRLFSFIDYKKDASPEADVIFANEALVKKEIIKKSFLKNLHLNYCPLSLLAQYSIKRGFFE